MFNFFYTKSFCIKNGIQHAFHIISINGLQLRIKPYPITLWETVIDLSNTATLLILEISTPVRSWTIPKHFPSFFFKNKSHFHISIGFSKYCYGQFTTIIIIICLSFYIITKEKTKKMVAVYLLFSCYIFWNGITFFYYAQQLLFVFCKALNKMY